MPDTLDIFSKMMREQWAKENNTSTPGQGGCSEDFEHFPSRYVKMLEEKILELGVANEALRAKLLVAARR